MKENAQGQPGQEPSQKKPAEADSKKNLSQHLSDKAAGTDQPDLPAKTTNAGVAFQEFFERHQRDFEMVIPRHMNAERVMRLAVAACKRQSGLLKCWMPSVIGGLLEAAALGLEVNGPMGEASLIPFKNNDRKRDEAELIIEYKGYIKLFLNHPAAITIFARPVFKNDFFDYCYGSKEFSKHVPLEIGDKGEIRGWHAYAHLKNGGYRFVFMPKRDVDFIRDNYSPSWKSNPEKSPWRLESKGGSYLKMGSKTALRELQTFLPKSSEIAKAVEADYTVVDPFDASNFNPLPEGDEIKQ